MSDIPHISVDFELYLPKKVKLFRLCCAECRKTVVPMQGIQRCPHCNHIGFTFDDAVYLKVTPRRKKK
jgi:Zn finger protein HypA/HybF involved in hydrogenase expression